MTQRIGPKTIVNLTDPVYAWIVARAEARPGKPNIAAEIRRIVEKAFVEDTKHSPLPAVPVTVSYRGK